MEWGLAGEGAAGARWPFRARGEKHGRKEGLDLLREGKSKPILCVGRWGRVWELRGLDRISDGTFTMLQRKVSAGRTAVKREDTGTRVSVE